MARARDPLTLPAGEPMHASIGKPMQAHEVEGFRCASQPLTPGNARFEQPHRGSPKVAGKRVGVHPRLIRRINEVRFGDRPQTKGHPDGENTGKRAHTREVEGADGGRDASDGRRLGALLIGATPVPAGPILDRCVTAVGLHGAWLAQSECCKVRTTGKACGNSCINKSKTCTKGKGCACDAGTSG